MGTSDRATIWANVPGLPPVRNDLPLGSVVVGRGADAGLQLADEHVSTHHAELYWDTERLRVRDLGSRNGTIVNGSRVVDWTELGDGDRIAFGSVECAVRIEPGGADRPGPAIGEQPVAATGAGETSPLSRTPIFVSHSSEDKYQVQMIADELRRRGWTVWIDEAGIAAGKSWRAELMEALERSWIVILVVSYASMTSKWVKREIFAADRLGLEIVPVAIENVPYPDDLRMMLAGVQQLDATDLGDSDRRAGELARIDAALLSAARTRRPGKPGRIRIVVGGFIATIGIIGIVLGFAAFAYLGFRASGREDEGTSPFIGWAVFAASMVVTVIGSVIYGSGKRKGI